MNIQTNHLRQRVWIDGAGREGLARVLDVVVPGTDLLPSGRSIGAHRELLDRVVAADPRLEAPLTAIGAWAASAGSVTLEDLDREAGAEVERVVFGLTAAYYMSRKVRELLGYPGQQRRPIAQATSDEVVSDDLVAPVVERGAVYVPTPQH